MARIVDLLETDYAAQLRRRRHPLLGCATVSVGAICGGIQANIVPDRCTILLDRRTLPGETEAGVRREISALLRPKHLTGGLRARQAAPLPAAGNGPAAARWSPVSCTAWASASRWACVTSAMRRCSAHGGIPSVVFGPGDIAQAHTADEWISLEALERGKELLLRFLQSFS